jgi:6,7-dimethyl-8-ribityllumazine synthase
MAKDTTHTTSTSTERLPQGSRIAVVASTYHGELVDTMKGSARAVLEAAGLSPDDWLEVPVPGAYELPLVARRLALRDDVDAVLCFGLVLRGDTDHDRYISTTVATRLMDAAFEADTPILFGVLTPNNVGQARRRARTEADGGLDKGREVARAAIGVLAALERSRTIGRGDKRSGSSKKSGGSKK